MLFHSVPPIYRGRLLLRTSEKKHGPTAAYTNFTFHNAHKRSTADLSRLEPVGVTLDHTTLEQLPTHDMCLALLIHKDHRHGTLTHVAFLEAHFVLGGRVVRVLGDVLTIHYLSMHSSTYRLHRCG